jgi:hypothetical protein
MFYYILLCLTFAILNALRGGAYISRPLAAALMGVAYGIYLTVTGINIGDVAVCALITGVFLYLGLLIGWGKGFAAITGIYDPTQKEFLPSDIVGNWVYAKTNNGYLAGVVWMTIRGVLFYPTYAVLALYTGDSGFYTSGLLVFTMGLAYGVMRYVPQQQYAVRCAELLFGSILGLALVIG